MTTSLSLSELGWGSHFEQQVSETEKQEQLLARVGAHFGSQILFFSEIGEFLAPSAIIEPKEESSASGSSVSTIAVGDWFLLNRTDHRAIRRLDRKTLLSRKAAGETVKPQVIASNVDTVFIVSSCNLDFNLSRFERYLALILDSGATPIIILTKADLCEDPTLFRQQAEALHPGLIVETLDARDPDQATVLSAWCSLGKTIALLGSSGVGKSTLATALGGFDIRTQGIREHDAKGRHTTTTRSMYQLEAGGWLIDTPGMRELQLPACEQGVEDLFEDVVSIAASCKFRNCQHQGDSGCAIEAAIESEELDPRRFRSYQKLQAEQARNSQSLAERRDRDRKTGQMYKRIISEKKRRRGK